MRKTLLLSAILIGAVFSTYAQDDKPTPKFGVGFSIGATTGPHAGIYPAASGLDLKFEYPLEGTPVYITFNTGYTFFVTANGYSTGVANGQSYSYGSIASFFPLEVGAKVFVAGRIFIEGDVGASFDLNSSSTTKTALLVSPSAGYSIPFGSSRFSVDLGLGYEDRLETGGGFGQVAFRAAFKFGL